MLSRCDEPTPGTASQEAGHGRFCLLDSGSRASPGWPPGTFLRVYLQNRGMANALAMESSIIGLPIQSLIETRGEWKGTARELLVELETHFTNDKTRKSKEWPASPRKLSGELRRLAPNLRGLLRVERAGESASAGLTRGPGSPSSGSPSTLNNRPSVSGPTGTSIGRPERLNSHALRQSFGMGHGDGPYRMRIQVVCYFENDGTILQR